MRTLAARVVRELGLAGGFVSAASGLARARGRLYVAVDDAVAIAAFPASGAGPGVLLPLADDELPGEPVARKAAKPDLEAIAALPVGALLVLGSGSAERRHRGFVTSLDGHDVRELDLRELYAEVAGAVAGPVNVEGAEWHAGDLVLAQRGTAGAPSALLRVSWPALRLLEATPLPVRELDGVALALTDVARLPDGRLLASYAAEATDNPYDDGPVAGSAIGIAGEEPWRLDGPWKVEGLCSDGREVLMVTDADDPTRPALLLRARLPRTG